VKTIILLDISIIIPFNEFYVVKLTVNFDVIFLKRNVDAFKLKYERVVSE